MIHERIEAQVRQHPHERAAIMGQQTLTYAELNQRANQLAHYLQKMGIKSEQRVALCLARSIDVLVVMVAILKVGACYVPLDPKQPHDRLSFILEDSSAAACIVSAAVMPLFYSHKGNFIVFDETPEIWTCPTTNLKQEGSPQQLAYIIYTSGTTGRPKGVLIEHQSVMNYADWFASYSHILGKERIDWSSNAIFDMAVTSTIIPLTLGLSVVVCCEETQHYVQQYLRFLQSNQVGIIKVTPSYFKELLREIRTNFQELPALHTIILGGEQLSASDCANWLVYYPHHTLANEYGPTEATVAFSQYAIDNQTPLSSDMNVPIGLPGNHMYCYILDSNNQIVAEGEEGELFIGGKGLARGYLNLPELTATRFVSDPFCDDARLYKTGDLCRQLPNGLLEYLGRIDRQVKIRGFRIELNEIEHCLKAHPAIQDAVVIVRETARHDKCLMAYYILHTKEVTLTYDQIRQYMLEKLPNYMVPVSIINIDVFPLSENGKLDENLLPIDGSRPRQAIKARSHSERTMVKIWSKELALPSIGIDENFWELGGNSLLAARIIAKINQLLDIEVSISQFYQAMTVQELAEVVKKLSKLGPVKKNTRYTRQTKAMPLSDFQTILWACKTFKPKAAKLNIISRKRIQGPLDSQLLHMALESVVQKHHILSYRISKLFPLQSLGRTKLCTLLETNLQSISDDEVENILWRSMEEITHFSSWTTRKALIYAKLFYLKNNDVELQLGIPHIISDAISMEILFNELSEFYLHHSGESHQQGMNASVPFSKYVFEEQLQSKDRIKSDLIFWTDYLKDAHLFAFPEQYIVNAGLLPQFAYSTYVPIPSKAIHHLEVFCMHQQASFSEALCATIGLSLINCCDGEEDNSGHIFMNIVKSARDNLLYDETIGCFIRIEPIKLLLSKTQTLLTLVKQLQKFVVKNSVFQQSSNIIKLASLNRFYRKKKTATYFLTQFSIFIYRKLLNILKINHEILRLCPSLSLLDEKKRFMIYLNIWNNFVVSGEEPARLFGLQSKRVKTYQYDLLAVDSLFEVCFLRDENQNKPYVVISSNLEPVFRERIAKEIIRIMNDDMVNLGSTLEHATSV